MKTVDELTPEELTLPPLHQAARQRDVEKTRALLAEGADVHAVDFREENGEGGNTALWYAAQGLPPGGVPVARLLLEAGADVNAAGEYDMTPLHMACSWGHAAMVAFLVEHGARLDARDNQDRTPADIARRDYAEGLAMPQEQWPEGFESWLNGMSAINLYLEANGFVSPSAES